MKHGKKNYQLDNEHIQIYHAASKTLKSQSDCCGIKKTNVNFRKSFKQPLNSTRSVKSFQTIT